MGWGANQWVRICKEPAFGTVDPDLDAGTLTEGTDYIWVRLHQSNAFTMRRTPQLYTIRSADGGNRRVQTGSGRYTLQGTLNTPFYPTQAGFLLDAACKLTGTDLTSYTIDHFDTVRTRRYLGCKVQQLTIAAESQATFIPLAFQWVGRQTADADPTLAQPAALSFPGPAVLPYHHQDSAGVVKLNNVVRTLFSSLQLTVKNTLATTFDEFAYAGSIFYAGRDVDWSLKSQYSASTDRGYLEAVTKLVTNQVKFSKGASSVTFDLKSTNYLVQVEDDLPIDNASYQTLTVNSYFDPTATTDLSYLVV